MEKRMETFAEPSLIIRKMETQAEAYTDYLRLSDSLMTPPARENTYIEGTHQAESNDEYSIKSDIINPANMSDESSVTIHIENESDVESDATDTETGGTGMLHTIHVNCTGAQSLVNVGPSCVHGSIHHADDAGKVDNTHIDNVISDVDGVVTEMEKVMQTGDLTKSELFANEEENDLDRVENECETINDAHELLLTHNAALNKNNGSHTAANNGNHDSISTSIPSTGELGQSQSTSTLTLPELAFSWDSTYRSGSEQSGDSGANTTRCTNQYLRNTASIYGCEGNSGVCERTSGGNTTRCTNHYLRSPASSHGCRYGIGSRRLDWKKPEVTVRWDSSIGTRSQTKKIFCFEDGELCGLKAPKNASRMAMESREAMFRRAMSLLSDRCASMRQGPEGDTQFTFGGHLPKYFYVTQDRPVPMEPLKAWRGYNGNIYFEPININPLKNDIDSDRPQPAVPRTTDNTRVRNVSSKPRNAGQENRAGVDSRSESRQTTKSSVASRHSSNRQMAHLDKQTVLNRYNDSIQEDIVWLEGQESTGSLAVRPKTYPDRKSRDKDRDLQYNKERIHKGSVAHRLFVENKSKQKPRLAVSGGKFTPPNSLSPLLRTQTQYSLSSNRLTTNSPDPYHLNEQKLPPLDQIRATVKPREANGNAQAAPTAPPPKPKIPYLRAVTITDDMKPFVKYSPDVVAKLSQQANIC